MPYVIGLTDLMPVDIACNFCNVDVQLLAGKTGRTSSVTVQEFVVDHNANVMAAVKTMLTFLLDCVKYVEHLNYFRQYIYRLSDQDTAWGWAQLQCW